ncbi:hypothetical protein [Lactimicrobium massiliense]|uniref:hypothetical protein n=1 Tax=Lactimicrobium massiliense TaxID=2161814 RepID=UPI000D54FC36|nr:hypothetical protein [Lactimicrobium massiliense]
MKKLNSNHGVSLSVALLYFLVCAVLASMIIAAATASTGRIAALTETLTETRQDDSAVMSGARLIADQLQNDAVIIVETANIDKAGTVTSVNTAYYESNDTSDIEGKTSLRDFAPTKTKEITDASSSVLKESIQSLYSSYLNTFENNTNSFNNGRLALTAGKETLQKQTKNLQITVGNNDNLKADAKFTLGTDMSVTFKVKKNQTECDVNCVPDISTGFEYTAKEQGNPDAGQTAVKTTIVSFAEASVSRP